MTSAFIGATYGVPFALVILQRLSMNQATLFERLSVRRLAARAGEELVEAAVSTSRPSEVIYDDLIRTTHGVCGRIDQLLDSAEMPDELTGLTPVRDRCLITKNESDLLMRAVDAATDAWGAALGERGELGLHVLQVRSRWEFLVGPVRTRILEAGFDWVDVSTIEDCTRLLSELERLLPEAWLPDEASRTRADLAQYRIERWEFWSYSHQGEGGEILFPYQLLTRMRTRYEASLSLLRTLTQVVETSQKIAVHLAGLRLSANPPTSRWDRL
jgi:hypothetical protein